MSLVLDIFIGFDFLIAIVFVIASVCVRKPHRFTVFPRIFRAMEVFRPMFAAFAIPIILIHDRNDMDAMREIIAATGIFILVAFSVAAICGRESHRFAVDFCISEAREVFRLMFGAFIAILLILIRGQDDMDAMGEIITSIGAFIGDAGRPGWETILAGIAFFAVLLYMRLVVIRGIRRAVRPFGSYTLSGERICYDLAVGLIDEREAERRQREVMGAIDFCGIMAGSITSGPIETIVMFLVAMAGVAVNTIAGIDAIRIYVVPMIGLVLVCQVPALFMFIACRILISRTICFSGKPEYTSPFSASKTGPNIELEISPFLIYLAAQEDGGIVTRLQSIRRQIAMERCLVLPPVRIRAGGAGYAILLSGSVIAEGTIQEHVERSVDITDLDETAEAIIVDAICAHFAAVIKSHMGDLLTRDMVVCFLDAIRKRSPDIVEEEIDSGKLSIPEFQMKLQDRLRQNCSTGNLEYIEGVLYSGAKGVQ